MGKLPNFLIVGAAKSGTTSIYNYLDQHPEVYMSPRKETRFISSQFVKFPLMGIGDDKNGKRMIKSFNAYKKLFSKLKNEKAIGEASIENLYYYKDAIKYIKKYLGDVKIIIVLRNPIERTFSQYKMFIRNSREYLSFEDALKAEDERINKNWAFGWHYKNVSLYYNQVKAYLENFNQVKVYLYDDLKMNPIGLLRNMYEFIGVDTAFHPDVSFQYNISGVPKNKFLFNLLTQPSPFKSAINKIFKFFSLDRKRRVLTAKLSSKYLLVKDKQKIKMNQETQKYLKEFFREDILKLQALINRDLSDWLK